LTQTPAIPTLPSPRAQAEARFIALMTELFQLAEAQALDFGLYRVIHRHNQEVRAFIGEIVTGLDGPRLEGGRLSALLDQAFAAAGDEADAGERQRLADLEEDRPQTRRDPHGARGGPDAGRGSPGGQGAGP
jgi:adenine-specific DNA-methyltransferase